MRRRNIEFADSLNTVLKMAEKRAYVGATLNANALSQFYTQDLEDEQDSKEEPKRDNRGAVLCCIGCGKEVSQKVADYATRTYGRILCMSCQADPETTKKG